MSAVQYQKAVTAYFSSELLLPFGFAEQPCDVDVILVNSDAGPTLFQCWDNVGDAGQTLIQP